MGYDIPADHHGPTPAEIERKMRSDVNAALRKVNQERVALTPAELTPEEVAALSEAISAPPSFEEVRDAHIAELHQTARQKGIEPIGKPQGYGNAPHDKTEEWDMRDRTKPKLTSKDTNPKDAVGTKKWRQYCTVPTTIIWALGVAMLEGARKYGRHNYRVAGVRSSVYIDAAKGHIDQWWEGEDIDEESKLSHLVKAMASLAVLYDAMVQGKMVDDRPPKTDLDSFRDELQKAVEDIFERHPEAKDAFLEGDQYS